MNDVWDVLMAVYQGKIGDCTPGDAIRIPRHSNDTGIRGRGEVFDCIRSVSISNSIYEGRTV